MYVYIYIHTHVYRCIHVLYMYVFAAIPETTIKDETNEFYDKEFKEEYEKIHRDAEQFATTITKALNELPVYYRYHIKKRISVR
jgi:hypothetical protein